MTVFETALLRSVKFGSVDKTPGSWSRKRRWIAPRTAKQKRVPSRCCHGYHWCPGQQNKRALLHIALFQCRCPWWKIQNDRSYLFLQHSWLFWYRVVNVFTSQAESVRADASRIIFTDTCDPTFDIDGSLFASRPTTCRNRPDWIPFLFTRQKLCISHFSTIGFLFNLCLYMRTYTRKNIRSLCHFLSMFALFIKLQE